MQELLPLTLPFKRKKTGLEKRRQITRGLSPAQRKVQAGRQKAISYQLGAEGYDEAAPCGAG